MGLICKVKIVRKNHHHRLDDFCTCDAPKLSTIPRHFFKALRRVLRSFPRLTMNGASAAPNHQNASNRTAKPPPTGPAPPAPVSAPPAPPSNARTGPPPHNHPPPVNGTNQHHHHNPPPSNAKGKKKVDSPVDPATMYESLKNRIAALEEEEVLEEEEERRFGMHPFYFVDIRLKKHSGGGTKIGQGHGRKCHTCEIH